MQKSDAQTSYVRRGVPKCCKRVYHLNPRRVVAGLTGVVTTHRARGLAAASHVLRKVRQAPDIEDSMSSLS